jgi:hypothetical protein
VATLIYALAPGLTPVFRDFDMGGDGLGALARAARGNLSGAEAEAVRLLLDQQILEAYPTLTATAGSWQALHNAVSMRLAGANGAGAARNLDDEASTLLAALTLQVTVDDTAEQDITAQHTALRAGAHSRSWFRDLGEDTPGMIARILLAPIADGQHRDEERERERAVARTAASPGLSSSGGLTPC